MKTQVLVLVPYDVPPAEISDFIDLLLEKHRIGDDEPGTPGRFDYMVGPLRQSLHDPVAVGRLPAKVARTYAGNICERANLPADLISGALLTPDGQWHDMSDFGWRMMKEQSRENDAAYARWTEHYRRLLAAHQDCWVVEVWAHS